MGGISLIKYYYNTTSERIPHTGWCTVLALLCTVSDCAYCPHGSVRETEERKKGRTEGRERRLEEGQRQEKKGWGRMGGRIMEVGRD